jgi:capsular polysaccharide transport system permease protein
MINLLKHSWVWRIAALLVVVFTVYWGGLAARRYVSEAHIIIESLQAPTTGTVDFSTFLAGGGRDSRDLLLLRDFLLSADMLQKLDAELDLRTHWSDSYDIFSRLLFRDIPSEWFLRHYHQRVGIDFDERAGFLVIKAHAYKPEVAQSIARVLVREGDRFMNERAQALAREQVAFAEREVATVSKRMSQARQSLLAYQNSKGLVSPSATVENISAVVARLEGELSDLQARRRALQAYLAPSANELVQLNAEVQAVEAQLKAQRGRLASSNGKPALNRVAEEYDRLALEAGFQQDVYKTALVALERSRIDASRTLKKISVLQAPTLPEYSMEPGRVYNAFMYVLVTLVLAGILHLIIVVIREHRD